MFNNKILFEDHVDHILVPGIDRIADGRQSLIFRLVNRSRNSPILADQVLELVAIWLPEEILFIS